MKNSRFGRLKYKLGLVKAVLLKFAKKTARKVEREEKPMFNMTKALEVLKRYDRLPNNPDISLLERTITKQLETYGLLQLFVFVCPRFNPKALISKTPENYMPVEAGSDLFEPRVEKILSLRRDLFKAGLPTKVNLVIGDNDAEEYIFPFVPNLSINKNVYRSRQACYKVSVEEKYGKIFGTVGVYLTVHSLAQIGSTGMPLTRSLSKQAVQKEIIFFEWLFGNDGPYRGMFSFSQETLTKMVQIKYGLYADQGVLLEDIGGILLQTEGPGVWRERTEMLRCNGSKAIPTIYPWIRKDEGYK